MNTDPRRDMDAAVARALDRFDVPPAQPGFADRIAAAAAAPHRPKPRWRDRVRRTRWSRKAFIGVLAVGLTSATAVAASLFGHVRVDLPQIAKLFSPAPADPVSADPVRAERPQPERQVKSQDAKLAHSAPGAVASSQGSVPIVPAPTIATRREARREVIVDRIERRLNARGVVVRRAAISARVERVQQAIRTDPVLRRRIALRLARLRAARTARQGLVSPEPAATASASSEAGSLETGVPAIAVERDLLSPARVERRRAWRQWRAERLRRGTGEAARQP